MDCGVRAVGVFFMEGRVVPSVSGTGRCGSAGTPEVSLNQNVKNLIQKLGEAIHESVSESENIAGVVRNIREQGFDVLLMLEATIGLNEVEDDSDTESGQPLLTDGSSTDGPFTYNDVNFLKSLRISLPDEDSSEWNSESGERP
jgi:hypothetical protein